MPAVLNATTMTLLRKYWPTCALFQARPAVRPSRSSAGSANGLPKISVLVLNEARNVQRIGHDDQHRPDDQRDVGEAAEELTSRVALPALRARPGRGRRRPARTLSVSCVRRHQYSIASRRVTRRVSAANVMVRKNSATPIAEA